MPASTSNTQVTRVHASKKSNAQVCSLLSTNALWHPHGITAALVHLLDIIIIMHFTSQFAISELVTPQWVQLLG